MTPIRFVVQGNYEDLDRPLPALLEYTQACRDEDGCLHVEDLRGIELTDDLLHLELWQSHAAFDAHLSKARAGDFLQQALVWQAPHHGGLLTAPRRQGQSGVEVYRQTLFSRDQTVAWPADEGLRSEAVRFPAYGAVRLFIHGTSSPESDPAAALETARLSRLEPGCLQFETFSGIEYPENTCVAELWTSAASYDVHWLLRLQQRAAATPPVAVPTPPQRRYGSAGREFYSHSFFTVVDGVLVPEDPALRMLTVRW